MTRTLVRAALLVLLTAVLLAGQAPSPAPADAAPAETNRRILTEIAEHSEQLQNLEYLSDRIGPRLTGSENLKRANEWTAQRFRDYGLVNVHLESWTIAHSWKRGWARARVVEPAEHRLAAEAAGWSPNSAGALRGPLVYVKAEKKEELEPYRGKLRGALVITTEPEPRQPIEERPLLPRPPPPPGAGPPPARGAAPPPPPPAAARARLRRPAPLLPGARGLLRPGRRRRVGARLRQGLRPVQHVERRPRLQSRQASHRLPHAREL